MILIIAEKCSLAEQIAAAVGAKKSGMNWVSDEYVIAQCQGHLCELAMPEDYNPEWEKWDLGGLPIIPPKFKYRVVEQTGHFFRNIEKLMSSETFEYVINACDPDREGEAIFRLVYQMAHCTKPVMRLWTRSTEPAAIRAGLKSMQPMEQYDTLADAAISRGIADWVIGLNLSRLFTLKLGAKPAIALGRVQTPTVNLVVEREREIQSFVKKPYWMVVANLGTLTANHRCDTEAELKDVVCACKKGSIAVVKEFKRKRESKKAPAMYNLTALQIDCNKQFGMTTEETLDTLQKLYEEMGYATYPRSSSRYVTDDEVPVIEAELDLMRKSGFIPASLIHSNFKQVVNAQKVEGHTAIMPTLSGVKALCEGTLTGIAEKRVLTMLALQMLAALAPDQTWYSLSASLDIEGYEFTANGTEPIDGGWKAVLAQVQPILNGKENSEKDKSIPQLEKGAKLTVEEVSTDQRWTSPPPRYTEGTLVEAMATCGRKIENDEQRYAMRDKGLGTEATRTPTIKKIIGSDTKPGFITRGKDGKDKSHLYPTDRTLALMQLLPAEIKDPATTGEWECKMADIVRGEYTREQFLNGIEDYVRSIIKEEQEKQYSSAQLKTFQADRPDAQGICKCPICEQGLIVRRQRKLDKEGHPLPKEKQTLYLACTNRQCNMVTWQVVCGHKLTDAEIRQLMEQGETQTIHDFYSSKTGKFFSARLRLKRDENGRPTREVEFAYDNSKQDTDVLGDCPLCKSPLTSFVWVKALPPKTPGGRPGKEMVTGWRCSNKDCKMEWLTTDYHGRKMKRTEWEKLLKSGQTGYLKGFVKKSGTGTYTAALALEQDFNGNPTGKIKMKFDTPKRF